jgi:hypothetical protein
LCKVARFDWWSVACKLLTATTIMWLFLHQTIKCIKLKFSKLCRMQHNIFWYRILYISTNHSKVISLSSFIILYIKC